MFRKLKHGLLDENRNGERVRGRKAREENYAMPNQPVFHCAAPALKCEYNAFSGVFRNLERGAARIFGDLSFRTQTNLQNSRPKNFDDLFFVLVTFHICSTSLRRPPQKPAKRHLPHHELQLRGGGGPGPPPA
jgi:hypothetical protein